MGLLDELETHLHALLATRLTNTGRRVRELAHELAELSEVIDLPTSDNSASLKRFLAHCASARPDQHGDVPGDATFYPALQLSLFGYSTPARLGHETRAEYKQRAAAARAAALHASA